MQVLALTDGLDVKWQTSMVTDLLEAAAMLLMSAVIETSRRRNPDAVVAVDKSDQAEVG